MKTGQRVGPAAIGLVALSCAVAAPSAFADGGRSVASATPVAYGVQQFGNTANGGDSTDDCKFYSWWSLPAAAGDRLTIDWEAQSDSTRMSLWAPGTTDFTFENVDPINDETPSGNLKNELTYTAGRAGSLPLSFSSYDGCGESGDSEAGPYDFTAYVTHGLSVSMSRLRSVKRSGTVTGFAHSPDGGVLNDPALSMSIQLKRGSRWATVGSAPVSNSTATIRIAIPRSIHAKKILLRAQAHGAGYRTKVSAARRVRLRG